MEFKQNINNICLLRNTYGSMLSAWGIRGSHPKGELYSGGTPEYVLAIPKFMVLVKLYGHIIVL